MSNEGNEMSAFVRDVEGFDRLHFVDELNGVAAGLRGASVGVVDALDNGIKSTVLAAFYMDALEGYASRLDALAADLYGGTTHLNVAENDGNGENGGE